MKDAEALFDKEKTWLYKSSYWTHSTRASFGSSSSKAPGSLTDAERPASEPSDVVVACPLLQMLSTLPSDHGVTTSGCAASGTCAPSY
ncbi:hypothetical protein F2Q70_00016174 [Brassica cretica]|uniref:Uncharacterized protein n=1 Tax=Brassica cretica TaxID=69181 RepID=A0A8S9HY90_BRACR|nr:hypothetical protein F2Q70_00016173 [Brassica cretica]KAF2562665.1 hypothetical protein F2Q70_00016174 [Brassica cretica]KAF2599063.1 hypothetical protein F2Q68_00009156 [Brassica cretica]